MKFINNEAKAILFVHPYMKKEDVEKTIRQINNYLKDGMEYVAIHSLGANTKKAMDMVRKISAQPLEYTIKTIETEKKDKPSEFSKIWYRGNGIKTYSLIIESEKNV